MALGFGRAKSNDVVSLISAKKYGPAIEILRVQLKKRGGSATPAAAPAPRVARPSE